MFLSQLLLRNNNGMRTLLPPHYSLLPDGFTQNLVKSCTMGQERTHSILDWTQIRRPILEFLVFTFLKLPERVIFNIFTDLPGKDLWILMKNNILHIKKTDIYEFSSMHSRGQLGFVGVMCLSVCHSIYFSALSP